MSGDDGLYPSLLPWSNGYLAIPEPCDDEAVAAREGCRCVWLIACPEHPEAA